MLKSRSEFFVILIFLTAISSTGCALILEGKDQRIRVHCEPREGVVVSADGEQMELVSGEFLLSKKRDTHFVTFQKEGYESSTISFNREVNPVWPTLDLLWLVGFPIAWLVDWQTGALYRIDPRDLHVILRKKEVEDTTR